MDNKLMWMQFVFYFFASAFLATSIIAGVWYLLIEPNQPVFVETTVPDPARVKLHAGDSFSYRRNVVQQKRCKAEFIYRTLACEDGFVHQFTTTLEGFEALGPHNPIYNVTLPKDVPAGECEYQVYGSFNCGLYMVDSTWHPIYITVLPDNGQESN